MDRHYMMELRMSDTQKEYMDKVVAEKFNFDKPYIYILHQFILLHQKKELF